MSEMTAERSQSMQALIDALLSGKLKDPDSGEPPPPEAKSRRKGGDERLHCYHVISGESRQDREVVLQCCMCGFMQTLPVRVSRIPGHGVFLRGEMRWTDEPSLEPCPGQPSWAPPIPKDPSAIG